MSYNICESILFWQTVLLFQTRLLVFDAVYLSLSLRHKAKANNYNKQKQQTET